MGDALLSEPRDPDGPPEEVFNCRCSKEEFLLSQLPADLLPQVEGRLTDAQLRFLGVRVAGIGNFLPRDPGVEAIRVLRQRMAAIEAKLSAGGVLDKLTIDEGLYNYFSGNGRALTVSIKDPANGVVINRDAIENQVINAINNFKRKNGNFPFQVNEFLIDTGLVYGKVRFDFQGIILVDNVGWQISGNLTARPDYYNFNEQPFGERAFWKEIITRAMGLTEGILGTPYDIFFDGVKKIQESGHWK